MTLPDLSTLRRHCATGPVQIGDGDDALVVMRLEDYEALRGMDLSVSDPIRGGGGDDLLEELARDHGPRPPSETE